MTQSADGLTARDRLTDLGMDSLIALELRAELAKGAGLGTRISSTIAFDTGTVGELTKTLLQAMEEEMGEPVAAEPFPIEAQSSRQQSNVSKQEPGVTESLSTTALLTVDELSAMSEEEVERLLNERLARR